MTELKHDEIRIDCAARRDGINRNGVTVTHIPTGITATVTTKSQHQNREVALEMIEWGLLAVGWKP